LLACASNGVSRYFMRFLLGVRAAAFAASP
jgi:hypothetical protein